MTDLRDGKEYKTITAKMFDGKDTLVSDTWMLEDLAYDEWSVVIGAEQDTVRAYTVENGVYIYNGSTVTAGECFAFYEGVFASCKLKLPFQGICPDGWHLPDSAEANRWRNFLENGEGVGDAFYRSSGSGECGFVDYLYTVSERNQDFNGMGVRPECVGKDLYEEMLYESAVRCVKGEAYVEPE